MLKEHLKDKDFIDISFISYELKWVFKEELMKNAELIKKVYEELTYKQKQLYKWYVYANIHTTEYQKNRIWDYLNSDMPLAVLYSDLKIKR